MSEKSKKVKSILRRGRRYRSKNFSIILQKSKGANIVAVVVSKRISLKAVERNKIKRRIKSIISNINLRGYSLICFPNGIRALDTDFVYLKKELKKLIIEKVSEIDKKNNSKSH